MDREGDDSQQEWSLNKISESITPTMPQSWAPTSSSTDFHTLEAPNGPSSWAQDYLRLVDPFAEPVQPSTAGNSSQQERYGVLRRNYDLSSQLGSQPTRVTAASVTTYGRSRRQSDREDTPRLERKNTKRRRTGPDRFDNYLHGDTALPPDTTTTDVFTKYPNHITDEDTEECWRLGLSARQISDLMPADTQFNSEGVHVQQHHSLIQKKFKTFKERYEMRQQAMKHRAARPEGQGALRFSNRQRNSIPEERHTNSGAGQNILPSTAGTVADLPDLKFRCYPFDPANDQAFEARISIELAEVEPVVGHIAHEDDEIRILDLLIRREVRRHGDILSRRFIQTQTFTAGTDSYSRSETDGPLYQQRSHIGFQQALHYNKIGRSLSAQFGIPWIDTATTGTASETLRLLHHVIDQIYLRHPANATPPSAKRPIFNFEHRDLRRWRVYARLLYYLASIMRRLKASPNTEDAGTPTTSSANLQRVHRPFGEVRGRLGIQTTATSDEGRRQVGGLSPVRDLPSTAFSSGFTTTIHPQSPYAAFGPATGAARDNSPQASTRLANTYAPVTSIMPSTSGRARIGHGDVCPPTAQDALPPTQSPQIPAPPTDSFQPGMPATASNLPPEVGDYISFPENGEEIDDIINQMIDWDEWDATSTALAESSKTAN